MKICVLGCGLRTPLLLHGLIHSGLDIGEVDLYDIDPANPQLMAAIGRKIAEGTRIQIQAAPVIVKAVQGSSFVLSSIRVGNMETRARDERLALECGFAGQETTGPAGFAMALRTIPTSLEHARIVERHAPGAWMINFTNPAGIITQAIADHASVRAVGICDTPAELIHQIARALGEPLQEVQCDYFGLNHLGWVRKVSVRGDDVTGRLLDDPQLLDRLYPAGLFSPSLIRALGVVPTEYLFFYYDQARARDNQHRAGVTRGEELQTLNGRIWADLGRYTSAGDSAGALNAYRRYLNRRNASYMKLDGAGESAFSGPDPDWDPFQAATGYHQIAVDTIAALKSVEPRSLILNVQNRGAIADLLPADIVEVPCMVDRFGARPLSVGSVPESVRGLMIAVKQYERLTVRAAVEQRWDTALFALTINPIGASWDASRRFLERLSATDRNSFAGFRGHDILH